jgi:hypothetical protein
MISLNFRIKAILTSCCLAMMAGAPIAFGQNAPLPSPAPFRAAIASQQAQDAADAKLLKAEADPEVRAAEVKLRAALKALAVTMLAKDPSVGPLFKRFEVAELGGPGLKSPVFRDEEIHRLRLGFKAVQGTALLHAYVRAKHDYGEALRHALAGNG